MPKKRKARIERLENLVMVVLPEKEAKLNGALARLAQAQARTDEWLRETRRPWPSREPTDAQDWFRESLRQWDREWRERVRCLDQRIDALIREMREIVRRREAGNPPTTPPESTL